MQEMWETRVRSLGQEDPLEEETATHSHILAWRIPRTEEPGRLQSMGLQESDTTERLSMHAHTHKYKAVAVRRQVGNCSLRQCNVTPNVTFGRNYPLSSL